MVGLVQGTGKFFYEKDQIVNTLSLVGHMVSLAAPQLCCCSAKAAQTISKHKCLFKKLYLWTREFDFCTGFMCHKVFFFF